MNKDMTVGSPVKLIMMFFVPTLLGNVVLQLYTVADSIIVGNLVGVEALAAVGATTSLNTLIIGFVNGISTGFAIPVAQAFGSGNMKRVRSSIMNAVYLTAMISFVMTVLSTSLSGWALTIMRTPDNIIRQSHAYIFTVFCGVGATMFYNLLLNVSRALGNTRTPFCFLILAYFGNIALDLLFVGPLQWGVKGAALAFVVAQAGAAAGCFIYMYRNFPELHPERDELSVDRKVMAQLLCMGLPIAAQIFITAIGQVFIQTAINLLGSLAVAAVTIASKIQGLLVQPMDCMGITMTNYSGQNMGAAKPDRIRYGVKRSILITISFCAVIGFAAPLIGRYASALFSDNRDPELLELICRYLRVNGAFFFLLGILVIVRGSVQGMGYAPHAMICGICELVARTAIAFYFVHQFGFWAICFSEMFAWVCANLFVLPFYKRILEKSARGFPAQDGVMQEAAINPVR